MIRLRFLLAALIALPCCLFGIVDPSFNSDRFDKGSHERFYAEYEESGKTYYNEVVDAYRAHCKSPSGSARAAVEWCRFIESFVYSEDVYFETAESDLEEAQEFLTNRFGKSPEAILYNLDETYEDEFFSEAERIEKTVTNWTKDDAAAYWLLVGQRQEWAGETLLAQISARRSFTMDPNITSGLLYLSASKDLSDKETVAQIAASPVFDDAESWQKKQLMDTLFAVGLVELGLDVYAKIKDDPDIHFDDFALANVLAGQGEIDAGRSALQEIEVNEWNESSVLFERLKFEYAYGAADSVWTAYEQYRAIGWNLDPFSRTWFEIALRHGAGSGGYAAVGFLSLGLLVAAGALAPLFVLIPIHYWYLRKAIRGAAKPTSGLGPWDLRSLWFCSGLVIALDVLLVWASSEFGLSSYFGEATTGVNSEQLISDLRFMELDYVVYLLTFAALFWRVGGIRFLGAGEWSIGKAIGYGALAFIPLRMLAGLHSAVIDDLEYSLSQSNILTSLVFKDILDAYGFWGLLLLVGILTPIIEETFFRGVILSALAKRIPFWAANLAQSTFFALVHEDLRLIVFYISFGLICGALTKRSNGLLSPIALHAFNNSLVCIALSLAHSLSR